MKSKQEREYVLDRRGNKIYAWDWVEIIPKVWKTLKPYYKDKITPNKPYQVELLHGSNISIQVDDGSTVSLNRKRFIILPEQTIMERLRIGRKDIHRYFW